MDVKEAIQVAKNEVANLVSEEHIQQLGLEEVELDEAHDTWLITLGFTRLWDRKEPPFARFTTEPMQGRAYKRVVIDNQTGVVKAIRNREET